MSGKHPEVSAMSGFYGGPMMTCAITRSSDCTVQYAYLMDAALSSSQSRLAYMLSRNLRVPRNEAHAGELRENVVPLVSAIHGRIDAGIPTGTLFPCEADLVKAIRLHSIEAGCGDPGRPAYDVGYPVLPRVSPPDMSEWGPILRHRLHMRGRLDLPRYTTVDSAAEFWSTAEMPGVPGARRFPVVDTLLSIPFSILHNAPRLAALHPMTEYQVKLLAIATEIMFLWDWDPEPGDYLNSIVFRATSTPAWPPPVNDSSRTGTISGLISPSINLCPPASNPIFMPFNELANGQVLISAVPVEYSKEGGLVAVAPASFNNAARPFKIQSSVASGSSSWPSEPETEIFDLDFDVESCDEETHPPTSLSHEAVSLWVDDTAGAGCETEEPTPLEKTPFCPGLHGGARGNDTLMRTGALSPREYVRYYDLSAFSIQVAE
ncbi:hypothetical protein DFH09DRAFT_1204064 [Mycena vulgaris]|nr:hypothetical protein DFH09DRAFT_1204064 [Mycena vulgaris]